MLTMVDRTRTRLLNALKSSGPQTAVALGKHLEVTSVAIRQHLDGLLEEALVKFEDIKGSVGRPKRVWSLTAVGHQQFPDSHSNLIVGLLDGVNDIFGPDGIDALIAHREKQSELLYANSLSGVETLKAKVEVLAQLRSSEGYMAEVEDVGDGYLLIENHCSICAAAAACQGFCRSELKLFQKVFGQDVNVVREEHLLSGDRRCVYRISPRASEAA